MPKIAVIGAGFAGLSAAAYLAAEGHEVALYEKNATPGGRARQKATAQGYLFDMGPSWYWMPDVFDRFFADFGHSTADYYRLTLLDPAFEVVFGPGDVMTIPNTYAGLRDLFESIEAGSAARLDKFMLEARFKYDTAMDELIYLPGLSMVELVRPALMKSFFSLQLLSSLRRHVRQYFTDPRLIALMEFPVLFLGAPAAHIPALYSLMNYAGLCLGTWYPQGGFGEVINAMVRVGQERGVTYHYDSPVREILVSDDRVCGVVVNDDRILADAVVAAADYHYVETRLLPPSYRNYSASYWAKRTLAPSCLIYYVGVSKQLSGIRHHTLFFDEDIVCHTREIYDDPKWPSRPLFYVCCPSRTDRAVAPPGHENLFLLMPIATGLPDNEALRESYFRIMIGRLEAYVGEAILPFIDYKESYGSNDFVADYHAYRGNAYGLANTLRQTAWWKPRMQNKKLKNLFYAGQLTVPGPGVPPSLISGKIAADQVSKYFKKEHHESAV
jgi:phytoene desaturase